MKKNMYAGALLLALCFGLVTYSCSDDDVLQTSSRLYREHGMLNW